MYLKCSSLLGLCILDSKLHVNVFVLTLGRLWEVVAGALKATRIGKKSVVCDDGFRTPKVELLLGTDGWVTQNDNGIK